MIQITISSDTVICMKTTLNLDDDLVVRAKQRAAELRTTLTALV